MWKILVRNPNARTHCVTADGTGKKIPDPVDST